MIYDVIYSLFALIKEMAFFNNICKGLLYPYV